MIIIIDQSQDQEISQYNTIEIVKKMAKKDLIRYLQVLPQVQVLNQILHHQILRDPILNLDLDQMKVPNTSKLSNQVQQKKEETPNIIATKLEKKLGINIE